MGKQWPHPAMVMAALGAVVWYRVRIRPWMYTWGADEDEVRQVLPGDELVRANTPRTTRAVTIDAPIHDVWPWLAQIGEGRGGFYSYSVLERGVGAQIHNASTIHPEWQDLRIGDTIWLARRYGDVARQIVASIKPNSHLVLMSVDDFERLRSGQQASGSWGFYLRRKNGWTRLLVRGSGGAVGHAAFDIPHFVMEQKMMRGIRDRAQRTAKARSTTSSDSTNQRTRSPPAERRQHRPIPPGNLHGAPKKSGRWWGDRRGRTAGGGQHRAIAGHAVTAAPARTAHGGPGPRRPDCARARPDGRPR